MTRCLRNLLLATTALLPLGIGFAVANPLGGNVVGGGANISGQGSANVTVNQSTQNAIINWNSFNIGAGETTHFNQPNSSAVVLNRVTGGLGPSQIFGTLSANGNVFLVNRDGILFGPGAVINTGGFLATTSDIKNSDFMAGRYNFNIPGRPDASIINQGTITAANTGFAALVAPGVRNTGTITATLGTVGLASGNSFTLDFYGDRLITLAVGDSIAATVRDVQTGQPLTSLVENTGRLSANGGRVELTAAAARQVVDSVINNKGVIEANRVGQHGGTIVLSAATASTKGAGAPKQTVKLSGTLSANGGSGKSGKGGQGGQGGKVVVTGEDIQVAGAHIDVSGPTGGGTVLIGGDWSGGHPTVSVNNPSAHLENGTIPTASTVTIDGSTVINASATQNGNGGKVIVWSDGVTSFAGSILALGGPQGGDGGFAEVSGHQQLAFAGMVDLRAPFGKTGTLLLDPADLTISNGENSFSNLNVKTLQDQLQRASVVVSTSGLEGEGLGNLTVASNVSWTSSNTLTLHADNNIAVNAAITAAGGGLALNALGDISLAAPVNVSTFTLNAGGAITTTAAGTVNVGTFTLENGTWRQVVGQDGLKQLPAFAATDFRISGGSFLRALGGDGSAALPFQIADVFGLQGLGSSSLLGQNFVLANNIDASGTAKWNKGAGFAPIGSISNPFVGTLDGQGRAISGLTIAPTDASIQNVGMFGMIGAGATVSNLTLKNVNVTANANAHFPVQFVGTLAGSNAGTIRNVIADGTVNGMPGNQSLKGVIAGGLVGQNEGTIAQSSAFGAVTGGDRSFVGGLAGANLGTITGSTASGTVTGGDASFVGGLVALNFGVAALGNGDGLNAPQFTLSGTGLISQSSATGDVKGGANSRVGGLVSLNFGGLVERSFATGAVSGGADSFAGGLVAANLGNVSQSFATGAVSGGDGSHVGGLVAVNFAMPGIDGTGAISQSYATGSVTGGANSTVGGLVADNGGSIDQTYAIGKVTGGAGSTLGGLVAVNVATFAVSAPELKTNALTVGESGGPRLAAAGQTQQGTVTNSYWDTETTGLTTSAGGKGLTTAELTSGLPDGFVAPWTIDPQQTFPFLQGQSLPPLPVVLPTPQPIVQPPLPILPVLGLITDVLGAVAPGQAVQQIIGPPTQVNQNPVTPPPLVNPATPSTGTPGSGNSSRATNQAGNGPLRPDGRPSNVPPPGETRFVDNEVVYQICSDVPAARIEATMRRLQLSLLSAQSLGLIGCTLYHARITNGRSVREVIIALERDRLIDEVAPNYLFTLAQDVTATGALTEGDPAQYIVSKLHLADAHKVAKGDNVLIAVIDSEIDANHPDLQGAIVARYDAVGPADKPHPHGTGMAGAIASHRKLVGTAPGARILAIRAFGGAGAAAAQGTTVQIVQGLDWAIGQGAKVVNMSFAGPRDPTLQKAFKASYDRGAVLIAAAGNAGPKSPPLYPGADPNVIAVSATDADDQVYVNANRGKYVALAAPGVDILVPAPDGNYEFTTGTSVAAAEVSGIVALLIQRDPKIDPATVREILTSTANRPGAKARTDELGYGIIDPNRALITVGAKSSSASPPRFMGATARN